MGRRAPTGKCTRRGIATPQFAQRPQLVALDVVGAFVALVAAEISGIIKSTGDE
jgi:hypothetical protein